MPGIHAHNTITYFFCGWHMGFISLYIKCTLPIIEALIAVNGTLARLRLTVKQVTAVLLWISRVHLCLLAAS